MGAGSALSDVSLQCSPEGQALGVGERVGVRQSPPAALTILGLLGAEARRATRSRDRTSSVLASGVARATREPDWHGVPGPVLRPEPGRLRVGLRIAEPLMHHRGLERAEALSRPRATFCARMGVPQPAAVARGRYPHQLSGGRRRRGLDRDGAGLQSGSRWSSASHNGPRRDDRGPDPGPPWRRSVRRERAQRPVHQPQSGRGPSRCASGCSDPLRWPRLVEEGADRRSVFRRAACIPTRGGLLGLRSRAGPGTGGLTRDHGRLSDLAHCPPAACSIPSARTPEARCAEEPEQLDPGGSR